MTRTRSSSKTVELKRRFAADHSMVNEVFVNKLKEKQEEQNAQMTRITTRMDVIISELCDYARKHPVREGDENQPEKRKRSKESKAEKTKREEMTSLVQELDGLTDQLHDLGVEAEDTICSLAAAAAYLPKAPSKTAQKKESKISPAKSAKATRK